MTENEDTAEHGAPTEVSVLGAPVDKYEGLAKKSHPIRGLFWGFVLGIGLALVLIVTKPIPLALIAIIITVAGGIIVGAAWSVLGPAKEPRPSKV